MKRLITMVTVYLVWASITQASVPLYVNYQGKLVDEAGDILEFPTTRVVLKFSIFDRAEGGTRVWGPQIFDGVSGDGHGPLVPVVNGYFNVILGPTDSQTTPRSIGNVFTGAARYLEITVNNTTLSTRQRILSAPYALRSAGDVPVGAIIPYFGNTASLPDNWKVCNGSRVNDNLSPLNGQNLPDLRGMFLRGADVSKPAKSTGGNDSTPSHTHYFSDYTDSVWIPRKSLSSWIGGYNPANSAGGFDHSKRIIQRNDGEAAPSDSHGHSGGTVSISGNTGSGGSHDNRPRFYSVTYIIRIK
jgi:hypothetical protein